jgi:hypothetical protein
MLDLRSRWWGWAASLLISQLVSELLISKWMVKFMEWCSIKKSWGMVLAYATK